MVIWKWTFTGAHREKKNKNTVSRLLGSWENPDLLLKPLLRFSIPVFIFLKEKGGGSLKLLISAEKPANELFY